MQRFLQRFALLVAGTLSGFIKSPQQVAVNVTMPGRTSGAGSLGKMSRSAPGCTAL